MVSVRKRQDQRLAGHRFRAIDTVLLLAATIAFLQRTLERSMLETPLAGIIPIGLGVWSTWFLMSALRLYRLGRTERMIWHFARIVLAAGVGAGVAALAHAAVSAEQTEMAEVLKFIALCGAGLMILHAAWWVLVARWRSRGLLTTNVVVVGATSHAADLISHAVGHRDMNILGVFDDRAERSPLALEGVPVLGTPDSMLRHRIMPYVDLIVVMIDQSAAARVRKITDRLAVLPNAVTLLFDVATAGRRAAAIDQIADAPLDPLHPATGADRKASAKRAQDLVIDLIALVVFVPCMALIALTIHFDSPGPTLFPQRRQGLNNELISVWKSRTTRHQSADLQEVR